jgi:hypothetical protein
MNKTEEAKSETSMKVAEILEGLETIRTKVVTEKIGLKFENKNGELQLHKYNLRIVNDTPFFAVKGESVESIRLCTSDLIQEPAMAFLCSGLLLSSEKFGEFAVSIDMGDGCKLVPADYIGDDNKVINEKKFILSGKSPLLSAEQITDPSDTRKPTHYFHRGIIRPARVLFPYTDLLVSHF